MIEMQDELGHVSNWFTVAETAKAIGLKDSAGRLLGRNKFFNLLRSNGVLMSDNQPYQYYLGLDLIRMYSVKRSGKTYFIPIFSERGVQYMKNKFSTGTFVTEKVSFVKNEVNPNDIF